MQNTSDDWTGCYDDGWQGKIVPDAFAHPAKFSRGLIRRIYQHAVGEVWLHPGATVVDPFGGVALGGLDAMKHGLNWCGVELESRFQVLGQANIDLWMSRYAPHFPTWGTAQIIQGDSRELAQVIREAGCAISSPPYAASMNREGGIDPEKSEFVGGPHSQMNNSDTRYGTTPGQLGAMPTRGFEAAVGSPQFEASLPECDTSSSFKAKYPNAQTGGDWGQSYGSTTGNIGNSTNSDFWSAARLIVEQVHQVLAPGGHAIWVCKRFVKNKKIVEFSQQWAQMCEAVGFTVVHWHKAMLVKDQGTQLDLSGNGHKKVTKRYSFFRRLHAQKYPELEIQWEDVICMVKGQ